jgi:GT2 family glycosyltransferase
MTGVTVRITVVIPTYERPAQLQSCLAGLAQTTYTRDRFEVIVVDDGGSVPLGPVVERYTEHLDLRLERQANAGPAAARNAGASRARGGLLAFTDDDCVPDRDWLSALARAAASHPGHLLGGRTINRLTGNAYSAASQHLVSYLYEYSQARPTPGWSRFFASNNLALPRSDFERIGGFDVAFPLAAGEDRDFCDRWNAHGLPMLYVPDACVWHAHGLTLGGFWRQHWNYGRGAYHFHQARLRRGAERFRSEPLSFYWNLLRYPLRHEPLPRGVVQTALLGVSQCANALGYFSERRGRNGQ